MLLYQQKGLTIVVSDDWNTATIALSGELETGNAELLGDVIATYIGVSHSPCLCIDLSRLRLLTAAGINVLLEAWRNLSRRGGWLRVVNPSPAAERSLIAVGLGSLIGLEQDLHSLN